MHWLSDGNPSLWILTIEHDIVPFFLHAAKQQVIVLSAPSAYNIEEHFWEALIVYAVMGEPLWR
jgi:hypothetical protein